MTMKKLCKQLIDSVKTAESKNRLETSLYNL